MSVDATRIVATILPVLLLAYSLDLGLVPNPKLSRRGQMGPALFASGVAVGLVISEVALLSAVVQDAPATAFVAALSWLSGSTAVVAIAAPHIAAVWGFDFAAASDRAAERQQERASRRRARAIARAAARARRSAQREERSAERARRREQK